MKNSALKQIIKQIKEIFEDNKLSTLMSIITLVIGIWLYSSMAIGIPIKGRLIIFLVCFAPFFDFVINTILFYKNHKKLLKTMSIILSLLLVFYYFIAIFVCGVIVFANPITNSKYYNYYVTGERLGKVFPAKIPDTAKNIEFYYNPGFLQAGTDYSLYYIDDSMTIEKFDKEYKSKAIWIGHKEEYTEKDGLLSGLFTYTPSNYENENDYIIYLIEGRCDDSGYCNHGDVLITAFNEKTNEVLFRSGQW